MIRRRILPLPPAASRHFKGQHPTRPRGGALLASCLRKTRRHFRFDCLATVATLLLLPVVILAQEYGASANDVIQVAERMYCPVCENIPLDECQTTTCLEWKDEIAAQLAAGRTPQQVIDSFVARFGDHVVGVPQDPLIRALTFVMPILATIVALGVGANTFRRFAGSQRLSLEHETAENGEASYRQRLERDVRALR